MFVWGRPGGGEGLKRRRGFPWKGSWAGAGSGWGKARRGRKRRSDEATKRRRAAGKLTTEDTEVTEWESAGSLLLGATAR